MSNQTSKIVGTPKRIKISQIRNNPFNFNEQSPEVFEKTKLSMHTHGQVDPLEVRQVGPDQYELIDGEHRKRSVLELENEEVSVIDMGEMTDAQAHARLLNMNELHGESNEMLLAENVVELSKQGFLQKLEETMPGGREDIERLLNMKDFDWDQLKPEEGEKEDKGFPPQEEPTTFKNYTFVLSADKMELFREVLAHIQNQTSGNSSEGRCIELMCADYLAGV